MSAPHEAGDAFGFPRQMLSKLPKIASPFPGMTGWLVDAGAAGQVVFVESKDRTVVDEHSHPEPEWCIVIEGACTMTIDGVTHRYRAGDEIFIPPHVPHSGVLGPGYRAVDFFGGRRHRPREG